MHSNATWRDDDIAAGASSARKEWKEWKRVALGFGICQDFDL